MLTQELVVAGFHRSGTSLVAQLLHSAGMFVGDDLVGTMPSNPYGHFEDRAIVRLHDGILADNGLSWQVCEPFLPVLTPRRWSQMQAVVSDRRARHDIWGFKDPRVCLFLPQWHHLLPNMRVIVVLRHPADSVFSLERRHVDDLVERSGPAEVHRRFFQVPDLGLKMWLTHNRLLAQYAEAHPDSTVVVPFDSLVHGAPLVRWLQEVWDLRLRHVETYSVFDASVTTSRPRPMTVHDGSLLEEVLALWDRLFELSPPRLAERIRVQ